MADEVVSQQKSGPKTHWSMQTAIAVMVAGGALILIAWFVSVEEGSMAHYIKIGAGLVGFVALCLGAYKRP